VITAIMPIGPMIILVLRDCARINHSITQSINLSVSQSVRPSNQNDISLVGLSSLLDHDRSR